MRVIYLAHPVSAPTREGIDANRSRAVRWATWIATTYRVAVIADWIWMTSLLEETAENRAFGLACDVELVQRADEVWMVGPRISLGMAIEAREAWNRRIPVYDLTNTTPEHEPPKEPWPALLMVGKLWSPENEVRGGGEVGRMTGAERNG